MRLAAQRVLAHVKCSREMYYCFGLCFQQPAVCRAGKLGVSFYRIPGKLRLIVEYYHSTTAVLTGKTGTTLVQYYSEYIRVLVLL